ncbi:hypothetical protein COCCADRAFT_89767 [Bipolaris zeicola 26-R-13]|uniref:Uncharacterized protein n=1 Tax=Cochliobolus carbonum (strain 26-R-13) TaxID=930089 RepID=W6YWH1_COCC2|nr:uncharacterized protein COCCADRAFT_89767 [Bipolaris zeicola 26-R-13]EUC35861.1 hypothetical protein COCCADRAFT_89767 [Bipolaris zeicola 26-R-13]
MLDATQLSYYNRTVVLTLFLYPPRRHYSKGGYQSSRSGGVVLSNTLTSTLTFPETALSSQASRLHDFTENHQAHC